MKKFLSKRFVLSLLSLVICIGSWADSTILDGYISKGDLPTDETLVSKSANWYYTLTTTSDIALDLTRSDSELSVSVYSGTSEPENYISSSIGSMNSTTYLLDKNTKYWILVQNYSSESSQILTPSSQNIININSGDTKTLTNTTVCKITNSTESEQILKITTSGSVTPSLYDASNTNMSIGTTSCSVDAGKSIIIYAYVMSGMSEENTITATLSTPQEGESKSKAKTISTTSENTTLSGETWFKYTRVSGDENKYLVLSSDNTISDVCYQTSSISSDSYMDGWSDNGSVKYFYMSETGDYYVHFTNNYSVVTFNAKVSSTQPTQGSQEYPTTISMMMDNSGTGMSSSGDKWFKVSLDAAGKLAITHNESYISAIDLYSSNAESATPLTPASGSYSVSKGTYYIKVTATGDESFTVTFTPNGSSKTDAVELADGTKYTTLSYNDSWFKYTCTTENVNKYLALYSNTESFSDVYYGTGDEATTYLSGESNLKYLQMTEAGTYYVKFPNNYTYSTISFTASISDNAPELGTVTYPQIASMNMSQNIDESTTEKWFAVNTNTTSLSVSPTSMIGSPAAFTGIYLYATNSASAEAIASVTASPFVLEATDLTQNTVYYVKVTKASGNYEYVSFADLSGSISEVYCGNSTKLTDKTLADWKTIQEDYPNAIAVVESTNSDWAKYKTNVLVKYSVGSGSNSYYECPKFVLKDLEDFYSPVDFVAVTGSYSRTGVTGAGEADIYASVCLPFDLTSSNIGGGKFLTFSNYNTTTANVYFTEHASVEAGTPCIVTGYGENWSATFGNTEIKANPISSTNMQGSYIGKPIGADHYKLVSAGDKFGKTTADGAISPFRAYLDIDTSLGVEANGNAAKSAVFNIVIDDDNATSVKAVEASSVLGGMVYDINGIQKTSLTKGINIIKGSDGKVRKVVVK